jgi:transposase-like protein
MSETTDREPEETFGSRIECPYCGHEMDDEDYTLDEGDAQPWECGECERTFTVTKHVSIDYTAKPEVKHG